LYSPLSCQFHCLPSIRLLFPSKLIRALIFPPTFFSLSFFFSSVLSLPCPLLLSLFGLYRPLNFFYLTSPPKGQSLFPSDSQVHAVPFISGTFPSFDHRLLFSSMRRLTILLVVVVSLSLSFFLPVVPRFFSHFLLELSDFLTRACGLILSAPAYSFNRLFCSSSGGTSGLHWSSNSVCRPPWLAT